MPREFGDHPVDCLHRHINYHIGLRVFSIDFVQNLLYVHFALPTNLILDDAATRRYVLGAGLRITPVEAPSEATPDPLAKGPCPTCGLDALAEARGQLPLAARRRPPLRVRAPRGAWGLLCPSAPWGSSGPL